MARPRKQPQELRTSFLQSRVTLAERRFVQEQAYKAGLSEAEYTRRRVLGHVVKHAHASARFDPALVSEINRLGLQLSAVGNLANQIARACHTDRRISPEWYDLPSDIKQLLRLVERSLQKVLDGPKDP
jgi:hypothetical protein